VTGQLGTAPDQGWNLISTIPYCISTQPFQYIRAMIWNQPGMHVAILTVYTYTLILVSIIINLSLHRHFDRYTNANNTQISV